MPYQLSGQLVATKSQRLPHAAGAVTVTAADGAFVTMLSRGSTSIACAAPANPRTIAAETAADAPSLHIAPCPDRVDPTAPAYTVISIFPARIRAVTFRPSHQICCRYCHVVRCISPSGLWPFGHIRKKLCSCLLLQLKE